MGESIRECRYCGEESPESNFYKGSTECKQCRKAMNMLSHAKRNIRCGNGRLCEPGCARHRAYAGLEFDIFDRQAFLKWARPKIDQFEKPSIDRIDATIGYVCRKSDTVTRKKFGNMQIIELSDNVRKARRGIRKGA